MACQSFKKKAHYALLNLIDILQNCVFCPNLCRSSVVMGTVGQRACVLLFAIWGPVRSYHACTQCTLYIVCNCIYDAVISCVGNKTYVVLGGHMLYNVNAFNMFTELCYVYVIYV